MASSLQASCYISSSSSPMPRLSKKKGTTMAINLDIHGSRTTSNNISLHAGELARDFTSLIDQKQATKNTAERSKSSDDHPILLVMEKLYAIMEIVADRVEMHKNIGDQRQSWNSLLLTSINAITLAATTISAIASTINLAGSPNYLEPMKLSSTLMFLAATAMLVIMNKIQPSQLAEEQRNAARLFKQLHNQIQTVLSIGNPTEADVKDAMEKVLALDKAYPLPLLGVMLEKFPSQVEPAVWWPQQKPIIREESNHNNNNNNNGWSSELVSEMKAVVEVVTRKDKEEYLRLGEKALKLNKMLAMAGPVLTGIAAIGSGFGGNHWGGMVGIVCGAMGSVVNAMEHGGQVGMVFEMYRNNAGFFKFMEESIETELMVGQERRENGELFEMKTALQLGRSLSELRNLESDHHELVQEFASKLF